VSIESKREPPPLELVRLVDHFGATLASVKLETWISVVATRCGAALGKLDEIMASVY
jgi:hypothetical protein